MKSKKLSLKKDTLSDLASDELRAVAGAYAIVEIIGQGGCSNGVCSIAAACCNSYTCPPPPPPGLELLTGRVCNF